MFKTEREMQDLLIDGECMGEFRRDKKDVIFVEVKE